jgi:hypothetical protein
MLMMLMMLKKHPAACLDASNLRVRRLPAARAVYQLQDAKRARQQSTARA